MTIKEVLFALDHDEKLVFKRSDGIYEVIGGAGKDEDGNYRCSGWCYLKEEALKSLGQYYGYDEEDLEEYLEKYEFIKSIPPKLNIVPDGTKVLILDNAKEECKRLGLDWGKEKKKMVGKVYEVKENCGVDYWIYNEDNSKMCCFPRSAFTVIIPEKTLENEIIITADMVGKKVKIIKE